MPADRTIIQILNPQPIPQPIVPTATPEPQKPKIKKHTVKRGDTLVKLGKRYKIDWKRIWYANKKLKHQDILKPGQTLVIPDSDAKLKARKLIEARRAVISEAVRNVSGVTQNTSQTRSYASSANTYEPGQCTWYVKNLKPEIPNTWGNASNWLYAAQSQGWPTGSTPRVGAVGWTSGHVVYITAVHGDTVSYTDMNGRWIAWEIAHDTAPASKYQYIY